jgi:tripartite-type tricarboxylate transporter receptor subunit TctC
MEAMRASIGLRLSCVVAGIAIFNHPAIAQSNFYEGKTVSLIVGNAAGGGYDVAARALARHMRKYIPGVANIIVKNMQGAGGLAAANYMYSVAEPDGLTFAVLSRATPMQPTLGIAAAKYKAENFTWLGTSSSYADSAYFLVTMGDAPFKTVADLKNPAVRPALIGGLGAGGTDTDVVLVAKDVLNLNLKLIRGYKGSTDLSIAMERGEIDGRAIGWAPLQVGAYGNYIREASCASCCSSAARRAGARCRTCRPHANWRQTRRTAPCSSWSSCRSVSPTPMSRHPMCPGIVPRCCKQRL